MLKSNSLEDRFLFDFELRRFLLSLLVKLLAEALPEPLIGF